MKFGSTNIFGNLTVTRNVKINNSLETNSLKVENLIEANSLTAKKLNITDEIQLDGDITIGNGNVINFRDTNGVGAAMKMDGENWILFEPEDNNKKWLEFKDDDGLYELGKKIATQEYVTTQIDNKISSITNIFKPNSDFVVQSDTPLSGTGTDVTIRQKQGSKWSEIRVLDGDSDLGFNVRVSYNSGSSWNEIFRATENKLSYRTNALVVDSNGNVGIGVSNPSYKLDVNGDIRIEKNKAIYSSYNNSPILKDHNNGNITLSAATGTLYLGYQKTDQIYFYSGNTSGVGTEKMRLTSSGNLGIGTTSPSEKLEVNGNIKANKIILPSQSSDLAEIKTTISDTNTYFDFYLEDDPNSDKFRWLFNNYRMSTLNTLMELYDSGTSSGQSNTAILNVNGSLNASSIRSFGDQSNSSNGCIIKYNSSTKSMDFIFER